MSKRKDDGAYAAFPAAYAATGHNDVRYMSTSYGMTLRQYAAIKLRVPDSGTGWLDDMIRKSLRDEFSAKAMQALLADTESVSEAMRKNGAPSNQRTEILAMVAYLMADAMLEARGK